jgi:hypothetical protein
MSAVDAADGSSTGTAVPWIWALFKAPSMMAATGSNANTRQVCSNVRFEGKSGPIMLISSSSLNDPQQTSAG